MRQGLILLAHGARDPRWRDPFEQLVERIRAKRPELDVRLAFLELMAPDLLLAGEELMAAGCDALLVVPVFFGQGGHVRDDVPALVDALRMRCSGVGVTLSRAAGEDGGVLDALASFCVRELDAPGNDHPVP
jgi:sirohydrochlorin cobaltochelatase